MPTKTVYTAQSFERRGKKLVAGQLLSFKSAEAALLRAERGRDGFNARTVGFVAMQQDIDDETGEIDGDPLILARFGELPRQFQDE